MLFNSWEFAIFLVVVFAIYHRLALRAQNVCLLIASYVFYGWWDWRFCSLLAISTIVDFTVARRMDATDSHRFRKALLLVSLATNLGILGFFKYFNFFADSAVGLLSSMGLQANAPALNIILPVGISFYTFQTMAYTIDVYRRRLEPCRDPIVFSVYVSYFPQLVAGPIERAQNLLPQFSKPRRVDSDMFASGCVLILVGLLRKMVIADSVAPYVDEAFADPTNMSSLMLLRAVALFSLQIYGDFAGYTDIARGVSRLFGIDLMVNFNHPYFATSITTFWRRWHISLSTWLRDYLYIPLGGNRGPKWFVYRNLMLTMLLGGLWHGAAWTFVIWGGIHGIALAAHKLMGPRDTFHPVRAIGGWMVTMIIVATAWVFFRAPDFTTAFEVLRGIASMRGDWTAYHLRPLVYVVVLMLCIDVPQAIGREHTVTMKWPALVRGFSYATMLMVLVVYGSRADVPFIYFQF